MDQILDPNSKKFEERPERFLYDKLNMNHLAAFARDF